MTEQQQPPSDAVPPSPANDTHDTQPGTDGLPTAAELAQQIGVLNEEISGLKDKLLRAMAETENVRRRADREKEDTAKYAVTNFARELAGVADNLRRAIESAAPEARGLDAQLNALAEGVEATERSLLSAFERFGVKRIDPMGQRFDPNRHQAMAQVEADAPAGTVIQVLQPGYVIHDRLLREAMVIVAKGRPGAGPGEA